MQRLDGWVFSAALLAGTSALGAEPAPLRYSAPIEVRAAAPFVQLALPAAAYARVEQPDLGDLRIVDARGERVPFALLEPRASLRASEQVREAALYPLPARPLPSGVWPSPVEVVVEGDRISVNRRAGAPAAKTAAARESGGWLIDLGAARPGESPVQHLRLRWSGPAEFSAAYQLEVSDDLRQWRGAGAGQIMALQSQAGASGPSSGALAQPVVGLPDAPGRFVRLVWADAGGAPAITGASGVARARHLVADEAASETSVAPSAEPAGRHASDADSRRAVHFDLGAVLPVVDVDLRFASGTHVAPVRVQGRSRVDEPWRDLGAGVFYRLQRGTTVGEAPALAIAATLRFVRLIGDERAAPLPVEGLRLVVQARLASLVFASQGQAPWRLLAGSRDAPSGALPLATLVPNLADERARFGAATLGVFGIVEAAVREAESAERAAKWRPWLLWSVLLAGVLGLGALVWRLARSGAVAPDPPP